MRLLMLVASAAIVMAGNAFAAECCADDACCGGAAACCAKEVAAEVQNPEPAPVREYARVTFLNPVKVGQVVLMGTYVIEHDNDRMARGGPCTYIYNEGDLQRPVVTFHCLHLDRPANEGAEALVTLRRLPDPSTRIFELVEFQFAGSADSHGVPDGR
jgi:hypothetical protein